MKLNVKLPGSVILFVSLILLGHTNEVSSEPPTNLVLDYTIAIDDPASHRVKVELSIDNNRPYDKVVLVRGGYAPPAPVSDLSVQDGDGDNIPYQITYNEFGWGEAMHIPSLGIGRIQITYEADLNNTDTSGQTDYYLDEEYGVAEWGAILFTPMAPHTSEDTQSAYGRNRNEYTIRFDLPIGWQEICTLPKEDDHYTWRHNRADSTLPGTIGFFHQFTQYTRRIGGVDVSVVFHDSYPDERKSSMSQDVFTIFDYATQEVGDLSKNLTIPTQKYIVMFVPEIDGVYPMNGSHGAHGYFRGDLFDDEDLRLLGAVTIEGFIGNGGAMCINYTHEGLISLLGYNGWVGSGRWTEAQKQDNLVNVSFEHYSSIAGTEDDKPICTFMGNFGPDTPGYTIVYFKTELFWYLIDELLKDLTDGEKGVEEVAHYLYGYHARVTGGVRTPCHDVLRALNGISGFDFSSFFDHYAYGTSVLPLYLEDEQLKIDHSLLPEIPKYTPPAPPSGLTGRLHPYHTVTVSWNPCQDQDLAGYNVYRTHGGAFAGPEQITWTKLNEYLVSETSYYDDYPSYAGENYVYYVVTAVSTSGEESLYSNLASVPALSVEKTVTPRGQVNYSNALTYTLTVSAARGVPVSLYDPLTDTTFLRFVEPIEGISHADCAIVGTLIVTPNNQIEVSFVAQADVPGTLGGTVGITNRACVYPARGIPGDCIWSNTVMNSAFRPYHIYLPIALRNY